MQHPASHVPLVKPDPTPGVHHRRLSRCVRDLQAEAQGLVLRPGEPLGGVRFQGSQLPHYTRNVAGCVPGDVLGVLRPHLPTAEDTTNPSPRKVRRCRPWVAVWGAAGAGVDSRFWECR
jgi:hypothetical protein